MKTALLVVELETQLRELLRVAELMRRSQRWRPVFAFYRTAPARLTRSLARCRADGWEYRLLSCAESAAAVNDGSPSVTHPPSLADHIIGAVKGSPLLPVAEGLWYGARHLADMRPARALLREVDPDLVVVSEDGLGANRVLIKEAHARGVRSVVVPFGFPSAREARTWVRAQPRYREVYGVGPRLNRWIARRYPHWVETDGGEALLRAPALAILVEELMGIAPLRPWSFNGGPADALAVESERMLRHYQADGLPAGKAILVGALYNDELAAMRARADEERDELYRELALPAGRPLVVTAIPPPIPPRAEAEFANYEELLRCWVKAFADIGDANVVYQLHPHVSDAAASLLRSLGARITSRDIAAVVPLARLFVTSVSSVIRLAIACGIPVVDYDVYRFRYDDYDEAKGLVRVEDYATFRATIERLTKDATALEALAAQQRACAADWGILDGRAGERMLELFDQLTRA